MMKLQIGDHKITSDGTCVTLSIAGVFGPKSKNPGAARERVIGHYANLEQAIVRVLEEKIGAVGAVDAQELAQEIRAAKLEIVAAVRVWGCEK